MERVETRDSEGRIRTSWRRSSDRVSDNRQEAEFHLADGSNRVRIDPRGGSLALARVVERFEQPQAVEQGAGLSWGGFSLSLSTFRGSDRRTLGYRFIEEVLALDAPLYALGEACDTDEGLVLRKPEGDEKKKPYILSMKSERELVRSAESAAKWQRIIGLGLIVGGIVAAVAHFV